MATDRYNGSIESIQTQLSMNGNPWSKVWIAGKEFRLFGPTAQVVQEKFKEGDELSLYAEESNYRGQTYYKVKSLDFTNPKLQQKVQKGEPTLEEAVCTSEYRSKVERGSNGENLLEAFRESMRRLNSSNAEERQEVSVPVIGEERRIKVPGGYYIRTQFAMVPYRHVRRTGVYRIKGCDFPLFEHAFQE